MAAVGRIGCCWKWLWCTVSSPHNLPITTILNQSNGSEPKDQSTTNDQKWPCFTREPSKKWWLWGWGVAHQGSDASGGGGDKAALGGGQDPCHKGNGSPTKGMVQIMA